MEGQRHCALSVLAVPQDCTWLFGRGASIASGLSWVVPNEWTRDLVEGRISRVAQLDRIKNAIRREMDKPFIDCAAYRCLLDFLSQRTVSEGHHRLLTTNWDYLLQRELTKWINGNFNGVAPRLLSTFGTVYHFNGSAQPDSIQNRSPFMLETDSASLRHSTYEANKAFNYLLWSSLVVIIGMSFECRTDIGLLGALHAHQDNVPIGSAVFVIVDPCIQTLDKTYAHLATAFPRAGGIRVEKGFKEWVEAGMPELAGRIFRHA